MQLFVQISVQYINYAFAYAASGYGSLPLLQPQFDFTIVA